MAEQEKSVSVAANSFPVEATEQQSIPESTPQPTDELLAVQTAVPPWEKARAEQETRIHAPTANETPTSQAGFMNNLNSVLHAALATGALNQTFPQGRTPKEVPTAQTTNPSFDRLTELPFDERVKETADMISRIDDPGLQRLVAVGGAVVDTATWTQNPAMSEAYASLTAGREVYNTLATALPVARDLSLAIASGGMAGLPALAATFGATSGFTAWNRAEAVRATTGQDYIHPAVAFATEGAMGYLLPRYISGPAQLNAQKMLYGMYSKIFPTVAPRAAQFTGAALESTAENMAQNYAIGNVYSIFSNDAERMSNMQLTGLAILAASMEVHTSPHALGLAGAEARIASRVNEKVGGQDIAPMDLDLQPAGMSVVDVSRQANSVLDRRINGAEIATETIRKVVGNTPISPEGINIIDTATLELGKKLEPAAIGEFKRSVKSKEPSVIKQATPHLIRELKAQVLDPEAKVGPQTREAYNRMVARSTSDKAYTNTVDGATDLEDFAQVGSHEAIRAMRNGDKPSAAFERIGVKDAVALEEIDRIFTEPTRKWKDINDEQFIKEAREIDELAADIRNVKKDTLAIKEERKSGFSPETEAGSQEIDFDIEEGKPVNPSIFRTWKGKTYTRPVYTDRLLTNVQENLSRFGEKQAKEISDKLFALREKHAVSTTESIYDFLDTHDNDIDWAIDAYGIGENVGRILNRSDNARIAAMINARINTDLQGYGYQVKSMADQFPGYNGMLTNKQLNAYARDTLQLRHAIATEALEAANPANHNKGYTDPIVKAYRTLLGGDISQLDGAASIGRDDPIFYRLMQNAVLARNIAGVMEGHIDIGLKRMMDDVMTDARALLGSDDFDAYMHKASVILDTLDDARLRAAAEGQELETVRVEGPVTTFTTAKIIADKFPAAEIQFAQKVGNFFERTYQAARQMNQSLTAINPARAIRQSLDWRSTSYDYQGNTYFARTINDEGMKHIEDAKQYKEMLPSERIHVNRTIGRKPDSFLSRANTPDNPNRNTAAEEFFNFFEKEWRYSMTQAPVNKHLDYALNHRYGYSMDKGADGRTIARSRRFWGDNGIEQIAKELPYKDPITGKDTGYTDPAIDYLLNYKRDNDTRSTTRTIATMMDSKGGRLARGLSDLLLGVPMNLLSKMYVGGPRGPLYTLASTLQAQQVSSSYANVEQVKNPLTSARLLAKLPIATVTYLGKRLGFGMVNTFAKYKKGQDVLAKLNAPPERFDDLSFQSAVAKTGFRKGDDVFNAAFKEYIEEWVPLFYKNQKWDMDATGDMFTRDQRNWKIFKKSRKLSDGIRAVTDSLNSMSDFLVWNINAADAASKAWAFDFAWEHFDRTMSQFGWPPKDGLHTKEKKGRIFDNLHKTAFRDTEFQQIEDYLSIGDKANARKVYARLFAELTTPSFSSANKSQVNKKLAMLGEVGRGIGRYTEWELKAIPNHVQVINEAKRGNFAPVIVATLGALAFHEMRSQWLDRYGESEDIDDRNVLGRDIVNTVFARNFQDVIGIGVHTGHWIKTQFDEEANAVKKKSSPMIPFLGDSFISGYFQMIADATLAATDRDKFDKLMKRRVPGYREAILALNGEYTEDKKESLKDFVDFMDGFIDNRLDAVSSTAKALDIIPEKASKASTTKKGRKQTAAERRREMIEMTKEIRALEKEIRKQATTTTAGE
jgi:hypothetical protein